MKRLAVLLGVVFLFSILAGCTGSNVDNKQPLPGSAQEQGYTSGVSEAEKSLEQDSQPAEVSEKTEVVLYFGNSDGYLVPVKRTIPKVPGMARAVMWELIKGPGSGDSLQPTMPEGTRLKDINIKDNGLAIVDFSAEFKANHWGGSTGESMTVYAVVNTLTQFSSVKEVQILVEGQKLETLAGHIGIDRPIARDSSIIQTSVNY